MNPPEGTGRQRIGRHRPVYRPHAALQGRVGILLHLLARRMDDAYGEALADEGATWQMYAILAVTAGVEGLSQNALAERIGSDRTTVSGLVADLSEDGAQVAVSPGMFDRRKREVLEGFGGPRAAGATVADRALARRA